MAARRSIDETRQQLLDVGSRMLVDTGLNVTLGQISMIDVCRNAGLKTAGSAYKIWPTQEDFRVDLLRHLLDSTVMRTEVADLVDGAISPADDLPSLTELIRVVGSAIGKENIENNAYPVYLALWLAARFDSELRTRLRSSDGRWLDTYADLYDSVNAIYGREWVPPFTGHLLAVTLSAVIEGLTIRSHFDPERVPTDLMRPTGPDGTEEPWHLYACVIEALIEKFTRPIESGRSPTSPATTDPDQSD